LAAIIRLVKISTGFFGVEEQELKKKRKEKMRREKVKSKKEKGKDAVLFFTLSFFVGAGLKKIFRILSLLTSLFRIPHSEFTKT